MDLSPVAAFDAEARLYRNTVTIRSLQADFRALVKLQSHLQQQFLHYRSRRNFWLGWTIGSFAIALVLFFVTFSLAIATPPTLILGLLLLAVALGLGAYSGVKAGSLQGQVRFYRDRNFADQSYRHEFLSRLFSLLERDILPSQKLHLSLDLAPLTEKRKSVGTGQNPRHRERTNEYFEDSWLNLRGAFADSTKFHLIVLERYIVCTWRNQNNNYRRREKHKGFKLNLVLRYAPEQHADLPRLARKADAAVQLPRYIDLQSLDIQPDRLEMKVKLPSKAAAPLLAQTVTLMLLSSYQILNLARIRANRAS